MTSWVRLRPSGFLLETVWTAIFGSCQFLSEAVATYGVTN